MSHRRFLVVSMPSRHNNKATAARGASCARRTFPRSVVVQQRNKTSYQKRPKPTTPDSALEQTWYTSQRMPGLSTTNNLSMGKYGLTRIDYNNPSFEPPTWQLPPHPPNKSWADRIIYPATLLTVAGVALWAYLNPEEEDMTEYWKRVESGQILIDDDDDDDDDDWDEDEE